METTHTKEYPKLRWYEDMRRWRKFEIGLGITAILALGAAVVGNYLAYMGLKEARNDAEESRIVNAWQILSNRSPGNTGKKAALETLNKAKENLARIDLSCETMGGMDENNKSCDTPTFLANVSLPNANLIRANLSAAYLLSANLSGAQLNHANLNDTDLSLSNLSDAYLRGANLSNAVLSGANLSDADLEGTNLSDAYLGGVNLSDAKLIGANLSDANLSWANLSNVYFGQANLSDADLSKANLSDADLGKADLGKANLSAANLSNVYFCSPQLSVSCAENLTQVQIDKAWAWADSRPVFKASKKNLGLKPPPLCPVELRPEYEANEETGKPDGC